VPWNPEIPWTDRCSRLCLCPCRRICLFPAIELRPSVRRSCRLLTGCRPSWLQFRLFAAPVRSFPALCSRFLQPPTSCRPLQSLLLSSFLQLLDCPSCDPQHCPRPSGRPRGPFRLHCLIGRPDPVVFLAGSLEWTTSRLWTFWPRRPAFV